LAVSPGLSIVERSGNLLRRRARSAQHAIAAIYGRPIFERD